MININLYISKNTCIYILHLKTVCLVQYQYSKVSKDVRKQICSFQLDYEFNVYDILLCSLYRSLVTHPINMAINLLISKTNLLLLANYLLFFGIPLKWIGCSGQAKYMDVLVTVAAISLHARNGLLLSWCRVILSSIKIIQVNDINTLCTYLYFLFISVNRP